MSGKRRVAMFGGTFNPPHKGHIEAARACVAALNLDKLYLVPASIPPHKALPQNTATSEQRLEMARLAALEIPSCQVWDTEMRREGKSFTSDTVSELAGLEPDADLWLIMGTDMLESFGRWHCPEKIVKQCRLAVVARSEEKAVLKSYAKRLENELFASVDIIENQVLEVSSTDFRALRRADMLTPAIWEYIAINNIYDSAYDFAALHERAKTMMSEKRYNHTIGCEKMAVQLAEKWGANVDDIRAAAILHDCTKNLDFAEQLKLCEKYGIIINYDTESEKQLFHADTAAAVAQYELFMPPQVVSAIKNHTLGCEDMSILDKIMYIADMTEQSRDYDGVQNLRRLAFENLDESIISAMEQTLAYAKSRGRFCNGRTAEALEALKNITRRKG